MPTKAEQLQVQVDLLTERLEAVEAWADEIAQWLHVLKWGEQDKRETPLPPALGPVTILRREHIKHAYMCECPICRGIV
jgi:hypothetical protein